MTDEKQMLEEIEVRPDHLVEDVLEAGQVRRWLSCPEIDPKIALGDSEIITMLCQISAYVPFISAGQKCPCIDLDVCLTADKGYDREHRGASLEVVGFYDSGDSPTHVPGHEILAIVMLFEPYFHERTRGDVIKALYQIHKVGTAKRARASV